MTAGRRGATRKLHAMGATNACPTGKIGYPARICARSAARRMQWTHLRPYRCQQCSLWHLGHLPQATVAGVKAARDVYLGVSRG
ncbi:MAG TPA: hypothetical protein VFH54_12665 [Mycobacteriales bacterium]|nr:hypothetical protein [Mycobacteriales bacterium]